MKSCRSIFTNLVIASVPLVMLGCATAAKTTFDYREPEQTAIGNEVAVDEEFENVWNRLVGQLAKGYFVVNNIEKDSRLINVSFATSDPESYIDCGESSRTFTQGKKVENFNYKVAESASGKIMQSQPIQTPQPAPIGFNTNQPNKDAEGISCVSKGVLEQEILAMAVSS